MQLPFSFFWLGLGCLAAVEDWLEIPNVTQQDLASCPSVFCFFRRNQRPTFIGFYGSVACVALVFTGLERVMWR